MHAVNEERFHLGAHGDVRVVVVERVSADERHAVQEGPRQTAAICRATTAIGSPCMRLPRITQPNGIEFPSPRAPLFLLRREMVIGLGARAVMSVRIRSKAGRNRVVRTAIQQAPHVGTDQCHVSECSAQWLWRIRRRKYLNNAVHANLICDRVAVELHVPGRSIAHFVKLYVVDRAVNCRNVRCPSLCQDTVICIQ